MHIPDLINKIVWQTFIEGKLLIEHQKWKERIQMLERERAALKAEVRKLKQDIEQIKEKMAELEAIYRTSGNEYKSHVYVDCEFDYSMGV